MDTRPFPHALAAAHPAAGNGSVPNAAGPAWRRLFLRLCFALVLGAAVTQTLIGWLPAAGWQTEVIGLAVFHHRSPESSTLFYLLMLATAGLAWALEPRLARWQADYARRWQPAASGGGGDGDGSDRLAWIGWCWPVGAALLPWHPGAALPLTFTLSLTWLIGAELLTAAADPARWQRRRIGLTVAVLGVGLGLALLDIAEAPRRGMIAWYNPLMVTAALIVVLGVWHATRRRAEQSGADAQTAAVRAAWRLWPLGAAPVWGMAAQSLQSPWADPQYGPPYFSAAWLSVAALVTAGFVWTAVRALRDISPAATAAPATPATAERLHTALAHWVWPLILAALVYERNLRLVRYAAQGLPFDFMHWGEWWDPWWGLQNGGQLWVNVFPIHGVGCDILPCQLAAWCGDATLSGRFMVTAVLNAISFVLFYFCLLKISRLKSIAWLAVALIAWEQPSWFKVWMGDPRYLPLFAWVLAALILGRRLAATGSDDACAGARRAPGLIPALLLGLLPLVCFLTSVDIGYVTIAATVGLAGLLLIAAGKFATPPALARRAGGLMLATLSLSLAGFLLWLGARRGAFFDYHIAVLRAKGPFDFLPLEFADALTPLKAVYVFATPLAVGLAAAVWWRGRGKTGDRQAANGGKGSMAGSWAFGPLAVILAAALYYKKGIDRADTAHFEQAAVLTPVLIAGLLAAADRARWNTAGAGLLAGTVCAGLLCWLAFDQRIESLVSHPARAYEWGPQTPHPTTNLPAAGATAGTLRCLGEQQEPIHATLEYIHAHSARTEPIYDFTNSGLWPFLAQRPNAARYGQTFHAMTAAMQRQVIQDLKNNPPVLVLFPDKPATIDFVDLTLRQHLISAWLLKHYVPVAHVGYYVILKPVDEKMRSVQPEWNPGPSPLPPPPPPNREPFLAYDFIAEQDQGFVPRAFAETIDPRAAGWKLVCEVTPATTWLDEALDDGLNPLTADARTMWRYETLRPNGFFELSAPNMLVAQQSADWLEIEMAVSGGTHGSISFVLNAPVPWQRTIAAWRRITFNIEPVKGAAQSRRYLIHLAATPNWMFLHEPIAGVDLQPTDSAGKIVELKAMRFWKERPVQQPGPGQVQRRGRGDE